jgi:hypothetical protein
MSEDKKEALSEEELDTAAGEGLPDREVMSTVAPLGDDVGAFGDPFDPGLRPETDIDGSEESAVEPKPGPQPA